MIHRHKKIKYDKQFFYGVALLVGTIVGVGLFGLPFIALQSSFWVMIAYFSVMTVGVVLLHHFYAEIGVHSKEKHHLPGHAEKYLGKWAKHITAFSESFGIFGAQLAYLIVGGGFLAQLFNQPSSHTYLYVMIFFTIGAILIWKGFKSVVETEFIILMLLGIMIISFFIFSIFKGTYNPISIGIHENSWAPYGVILFSLWGLAILPEIIELFPKQEKKVNRVTFLGVTISALVYIMFIWSVLRLSGGVTSTDSLSGLQPFLPSVLYKFGLVFGLLTTFTSFLALGLAIKKLFMEDYHLPKSTSWFIAMGVPLLFYFMGFDNFLSAISISGSIGFTISGVVIFLIYLKLKKRVEKKPDAERVIHHKFFTHTGVIITLIILAVVGGIISIFFELTK